MKKHRNVFIVLLAVLAILTITSCSDSPGNAKAEVRVVGSGSSPARSLDATRFESATVEIDNVDITDKLVATNEGSGSNTVYAATVETPSKEIYYSVTPKAGFVFDEWEIDEKLLEKDYPNRREYRKVLRAIEEVVDNDRKSANEESQSIFIRPEYVKYLKPTFDRGIHLDPNLVTPISDADGSAKKPYKNLDEFDATKWNHDELTIKIRGENAELELDLSTITSTYKDELEIKILGGYGAGWEVTENKAKVTKLVLPTINSYLEEVELEFRNIVFDSMDLSSFTKDVEVEFENCEIGTLKVPSNMKVVNGVVVTNTVEGNDITFFNSVVPYDAKNTYYHCLVKDVSGKLEGSHNLVTGTLEEEDKSSNQVVTDDKLEGYKLETGETELLDPLNEDDSRFGAIDDVEDYLEEDIIGRDRVEFGDSENGFTKVSIGPYEYQNID